MAKYPAGYWTSGQIYGWIPDIWLNIRPSTGHLAIYQVEYRIYGLTSYRIPDVWLEIPDIPSIPLYSALYLTKSLDDSYLKLLDFL